MPPLDLIQVAQRSGFPLPAFFFVQRGLDYAVRQIHGNPPEDEDQDAKDPQNINRHVSGVQLCHGLRDYAIDQYGLLAHTVLRRWNICECKDFGRIVFAMVDAGLMHKTDDDTVEDFAGVFEFTHAFADPLVLNS